MLEAASEPVALPGSRVEFRRAHLKPLDMLFCTVPETSHTKPATPNTRSNCCSTLILRAINRGYWREVPVRLHQFHLSGIINVPESARAIGSEYQIETIAFDLRDGRRVRPVIAFVIEGECEQLVCAEDLEMDVVEYIEASLEPFP